MSYMYAGYAVAVVTIAVYAIGLVGRRRRLERTVATGPIEPGAPA